MNPSPPPPDVPGLLREFGRYSALQGGHPYRAKAYALAAENYRESA